ncbi:MAG: alpha-galactosidase [Clostridia bacterium]|nr:alpha-galactosidase [Clostridia bacterium]
MILKQYEYGDTAVYFVKEPVEGHELESVGLVMYPVGIPLPEKVYSDSLIQVAFTGDRNLIDYTQGLSMRNRTSSIVEIVSQTADEKGILTVLSDGKGNEYVHTLAFDEKTNVFACSVRYTNKSEEIRTLEMLDSFSLSGILALSRNLKSTCGLTLHRMTAAWSRECRLKSDSFSHLGLDMSWARYGVKTEKFGERGSMPVRDYFPFAAIEDESGVIFSAMMEAPYSWQMEVYEEKESCSLSGGLGDYEFAHWRKEILPGESFETDKAYLRVKRQGGVNGVCNDFVHFMDARLSVPQSEESMPVLFNEYCTTWGTPSEENVKEILKAIKPLSLDYFVIDCGWYLPEHCGWCNSPGDWNESKTLFPEGIRKVSDLIRAEGMIPGVWFEFEVAGIDSELYKREEYLLQRDGVTLSSKNRRFLDLRKECTQAYLQVKMIDFLKENGFGYIKIDYNDNIGIGCDGAESVGEGGRQVVEESLRCLDALKEAIPDLIIENCSSGGSRIEPKRMSMVSMCSYSDAHECLEIPIVAANVSRVVPARQEQIWAVIRKDDTASRIIYSMTAAMMGRICLSGDIWLISDEKIALLEEGIQFYKRISDVVRYGDVKEIDCTTEYYRELKGRQIYRKAYGNRELIIVHTFDDEGVELSVEGTLVGTYTDMTYCVSEGTLRIDKDQKLKGGAFLFQK